MSEENEIARQHAPLPWSQYAKGTQIYGADRFFITTCQGKNSELDAALIVLCVNCHKELIDALEELIDDHDCLMRGQEADDNSIAIVNNCKRILTKARGQQ